MKKLFFLTTVAMSFFTTNASEKQITAIIRPVIDPAKKNQYGLINSMPKHITLPLMIGNKTIGLEDLEKFSADQRNLLYEVSHPSCCLMPYGVSNTVLREEDIKRLYKAVPSFFTEDFGFFVVEPSSDYQKAVDCFCASTFFVSFPAVTAGTAVGIAALCKFGCLMSPVFVGGISGGISGVGYAAVAALTKLLYPCVCRDKEWRSFNDQEISVTLEQSENDKSLQLEASSSDSDL